MKKLIICVICAAIMLGFASSVNAKTSLRKISTNIKTWEWRTCDVNKNGRTDIDDITRIIDNCFLDRWSSNKCDLNKNWKFNIEDVTYFYDVCYNEILNQPKWNSKVRALKTNQLSKNRRR